MFENIGESAIALVVSVAAALLAAIAALFVSLWIGVRLCGIAIAFAPCVALITGTVVLVMSFRKIRSI